MDRINHPTAVDIGGGKRGFRSKDTVAGVPGTVATATHLNAQQEEIVRAIEASGQEPSGSDFSQLLKANRSQRPNWMGEAGGTATALIVTLDPAPASFAEMLCTPLYLITTGANGANPTLNPNNFGNKDIVWPDGSPIEANSWHDDTCLKLVSDGIRFRLMAGGDREAARFTNRKIFTAAGAGTFTATYTGLHRIKMWGPGGGGGAGAGSGAAGGGAGGEYVEDFIALVKGVTYNFVVGAGGTGGAAPNGGGNVGTDTTFTHGAGTLTANRGGAGAGANAGSSGLGGIGGSGAVVSPNGLTRAGGSGYQGQNTLSLGGQGGQGGNGGGIGGVPSTGGGNNASSPGGGGGGSTFSGPGGAGARGEVILEW